MKFQIHFPKMQGGNDARLVNWLGEPAEEHVSQSPIHLYPIPVFMRFHVYKQN